MEFHEIANLLPMDKKSIADLAEDIAKTGQKVAIALYQGKILDGRRRWQACQIAGVEPKMVEVNPDDPLGYVKSLNVHRRNLTPSQLSMVAARFRDYYDRQAKERHGRRTDLVENNIMENFPQSSTARDAAGKEFGVSGKSVDFATKVLEEGVPELVEAVDQGRIAVSTAAKMVGEPQEIQREKAMKATRTYTSSRGGGKKQSGEKTSMRHVVENGCVYDGPRYAVMAIEQLKRIEKLDPNRDASLDRVVDWINKNR